MIVQLVHVPSVKKPILPQMLFTIFCTTQLNISMCIYFWAAYSVPLFYKFILLPKVYTLDYYGYIIIQENSRLISHISFYSSELF